MENIIVPFRLHNTWLGLDIECVRGIDSCGKMSFMPNVQDPIIGLMQKKGRIYPIWSLFPMVNGKKEEVQHCSYFIEAMIQGKLVAIPAHEILAVSTVFNSWIPIFKYGLRMYRSLDKKSPQSTNNVQEVREKTSQFSDNGFNLEEIY